MTGPRDAHGQRARVLAREALPDRFARALAARSMTLTGLQRRLLAAGHEVALSSLSAWRSGQRRPESAASLDAVSEIESILDLPRGHLLGVLGPARRPGPRPPEAPIEDVVHVPVPILAALENLGVADWEDWLVEEAVHVAADIDRDGSMTHVTVRTLLRGTRAGACAYPVYAFTEMPIPAPLEITVLAGGAVVGEVVDLAVGWWPGASTCRVRSRWGRRRGSSTGSRWQTSASPTPSSCST